MKMSSLIIGFLIFGFILTGMTQFYGDLFTTYNTPNSQNISIDVDESRDEVTTGVQDISKNLSQTEGGDTGEYDDPLWLVTLNAWGKGMITLLTFPGKMMAAVTNLAGGVNNVFAIPEWVMNLISAVVWSIFTFTILYIVFKVRI